MSAQLTRDQAIAFHDQKLYEPMTYRQRAEFQMHQQCLCMPFGVFHEAIEKTLGRPVFTHEFALNKDGLVKEMMGERPSPRFDEILALTSQEKLIVIATQQQKDG